MGTLKAELRFYIPKKKDKPKHFINRIYGWIEFLDSKGKRGTTNRFHTYDSLLRIIRKNVDKKVKSELRKLGKI